MAVLQLILLVSFTLISSALGRSKLPVSDASPSSSEVDSYVYCDRDYSCVGCSTVRVCAPTEDGQHLYEISRFSCGSSYPYCNYTSGSCSSTPDPVCANVTVSTNFTCMRDGYYPDPYSCATYYHCLNKVPYQYSCKYPYSYYHPGYQYCISSNYYCTDRTSTPLCQYSSYVGRKTAITYTNNYFLYCGSNGTAITVDRCIGAYYFNSTAQICMFECPNEGLFLNNNNCTSYYKCSPRSHEAGRGLVMTEMTCPEGQGFLESEYSCVNKSLVPNCNVTYPELFSK